jgi:hypothetical protein
LLGTIVQTVTVVDSENFSETISKYYYKKERKKERKKENIMKERSRGKVGPNYARILVQTVARAETVYSEVSA